MNKVNLVGRICNDLDVKEFKDSSCVRFTVAVDDGKDTNGERKSQFIDCIAWNSLADVMDEYCFKGQRIGVSGKLNKNVFEKDGVKHYQMEVLVKEIELLQAQNEASAPKKEEKKEYSNRKRSYKR